MTNVALSHHIYSVPSSQIHDKPPKHFSVKTNHERENIRSTHDLDQLLLLIAHGFSDAVSSSSGAGEWRKLCLLWPSKRTTTSSDSAVFEQVINALRAEEKIVSVTAEDASKNLFELRRLTGFKWEKLADLLNVDRHTIHNWVKDGEIREQNRERIAEALRVFRYIDRGTAEDNERVLEQPMANDKTTPFAAIKAGRYWEVSELLAAGKSRPQLPALSDNQINYAGWSARSMAIYEEATGSDEIQALLDEPVPAGRKRQKRRA